MTTVTLNEANFAVNIIVKQNRTNKLVITDENNAGGINPQHYCNI